MSQPRVSVIMAVYNGARWLGSSVPSVLTQDYTDLEFIVVDDCSTDETAAMLAAFGDPRLVCVRNARNLGQTASLNRALELARAPLIARIDADDRWAVGKLGKQMAYLERHPEVTVLGTWATRIDLQGRAIGDNNPPVHHDEVTARLLRGVPVCHVSVVMRREAVRAAGGYPERYRFAADYGLWSAIARAGGIITNLPEHLTFYLENPATFGATQKLGAAGDESAEIIRMNALALAGAELTAEQSREIALMFFPAAVADVRALLRAYLSLARVQRTVTTRPHARLQLWSVLLWALAKYWTHARVCGRAWLREWAGMLGRHLLQPGLAMATLGAGLLAVVGPASLARVKAVVAPLVIGRRR